MTTKPKPGMGKPTEARDFVDIEELVSALQAVRDGDFSVRLPGDRIGLAGKVADTFNDIVAANRRMAQELERVGHSVGKQGKTRQRVRFERSAGAPGARWRCSVNTLIDDLLRPTTEVTRAIAAVAQGDLMQTCGSTSTGGRSRASSCAPPPSSTR